MTSQASKHPLRKFLDGLYNAGGIAAAICLVAILVVIIAQMVTRWNNVSVPGLNEYAGYLMASASFLAFAHALNSGSHIRVNLFITALGDRKFWGELWCMVIGTAASAYLAWYAVRLVYWSRKLGDLSQGQDATPMWIVQTPMAVGAVLLAICFADNLVSLILRGRDNIGSDTVGQSHGE